VSIYGNVLVAIVIAVCAALSGCSTSSLYVSERNPSFKTLVSRQAPIFDLKISMTPEVQRVYDSEARLRGFDADKLLAVTLQKLEDDGVLEFDNANSRFAAEIVIKELNIKDASNTIGYGILAGSDRVKADIRLLNRVNGQAVSSVSIEINRINEFSFSLYRFSAENRMNYIYKVFSERVLQAFAD